MKLEEKTNEKKEKKSELTRSRQIMLTYQT
jgi:hypothetical protein